MWVQGGNRLLSGRGITHGSFGHLAPLDHRSPDRGQSAYLDTARVSPGGGQSRRSVEDRSSTPAAESAEYASADARQNRQEVNHGHTNR